MVEDIRLQVFIRYPGCGCREEIQFQRYTVIGRLKLAHHASHIMIHPRMALQVTIQICTEDTKIRLATTIHKDGVIDMMFFIILLNHLFRLFNIVCQELYLAILRQHFRRTEPHTVHIDIDRTFDTASATLLHTTPVLERVAYEQVRRNSSDGFVEITNLHCIQ